MPDLDAALTRLGALAEEASNQGLADLRLLGDLKPRVIAALVGVARAADDLEAYYPCVMDTTCLDSGVSPMCPSCRAKAALDALAALLTKDHAWCTRSGCEDTWGDRRHCICGVGECPVLTGGESDE